MRAMGQAARELRLKMVREQVEARGVHDESVLHAMRTVPRHLFVPEELSDGAYRDRPLPIGGGQTISQPYIVAAMTEALGVGAGDRVLEVGTGTGYQAAVLAEVASEVHTVELVAELARAARERLARLGYRNVFVHEGDGVGGWSPGAPFDGILVACGASSVPPALLTQLAVDRRLVIPVGQAGEIMDLQVWTKHADGTATHTSLMEVRFVPMVVPVERSGD